MRIQPPLEKHELWFTLSPQNPSKDLGKKRDNWVINIIIKLVKLKKRRKGGKGGEGTQRSLFIWAVD